MSSSHHARRGIPRIAMLVMALLLGTSASLIAATHTAPRITAVDVSSGTHTRILVSHNVDIKPVTAEQVSITPAVEYTVTTQGRQILVSIKAMLAVGQQYELQIRDVQGFRGPVVALESHRWTVADPRWCALIRAKPDSPKGLDEVRCGKASSPTLTASRAAFSRPRISQLAVFAHHLLVSSVADDGTVRLDLVDLDKQTTQPVDIPRTTELSQLQARTSGDRWLIGAVLLHDQGKTHLWFASGQGEISSIPKLMDLTDEMQVRPLANSWLPAPDARSLLLQDRSGRALVFRAAHTSSPIELGRVGQLRAMADDGQRLTATGSRGEPVLIHLPSTAQRQLKGLSTATDDRVTPRSFWDQSLLASIDPADPTLGGRLVRMAPDAPGDLEVMWQGAGGWWLWQVAPAPAARLLAVETFQSKDTFTAPDGAISLHAAHAKTAIINGNTRQVLSVEPAVAWTWET